MSQLLRAGSVVAALLMVAGASGDGAALALISVTDEIALGRQAHRDVQRQVPALRDTAIQKYAANLGRQLAARAPGPRYPYSFTVADRRDLNAFALPGGPVWVHRGILHAATSESELAGVLAHEVAHIAQRHAADQITKGLVANGLLGLLGAVLGNDPGGARTAQAGARLLAGSYLLKFSREDEREADRVGVQVMRRAGWDPRGMADFLEKLRRAQGRDPRSVEVFLSSHPAPGERAAAARALAPRGAGGRRDSQAFRSARARALRLPPSPAAKAER